MVFKKKRGIGLIETLLVLPIFTLLIAGVLIIYKAIESKNIALNDASQINLITHRLKRDIREPLTTDLMIDNENVKVYKTESNNSFLDSMVHSPLSWQSEVEIAFTPKKNPIFSGENLDRRPLSEKNLLLIDSWDLQSKFGKKLKHTIDLTHAVILFSLFGR